MTRQQALEFLELEESSSQQEIRTAFQEVFNELQIRITNAPTDHQRKLYSRRLKEVEEAYEVLGENSVEDTSELPNIGPVEVEARPKVQPKKEPENEPQDISESEAMKLLGLKRPFTPAMLEDAYRSKNREFEEGLASAPNEIVRSGFLSSIEHLKESKKVLQPFAQEPKAPEMTKEDAVKVLGIKEPFTADVLRSSYDEKRKEFEKGMAGAPNEIVKSGFKSSLKNLKEAKNILKPHIQKNKPKPLAEKKEKPLSSKEAQKIMGLKSGFTPEALSSAYEKKKREFQEGISDAPNETVKAGFERSLKLLEQALLILKPLARMPVTKKETSEKSSGKRSVWPVLLGAAVIIVAAGVYFWFSGQDSQSTMAETAGEPEVKEEFASLKNAGDSLALLGEWQLALAKYREASALREDDIIADSIFNIESRLGSLDEENTTLTEDEYPGDDTSANTAQVSNHEAEPEKDSGSEGLSRFSVSGVNGGAQFDYTGQVMNGLPHGEGTATFSEVITYTGNWSNGRMSGQGTLVVVNGNKYVGEWRDALPHGRGTLTYPNGDTYNGEWKNGKRDGRGTASYSDGSRYAGTWKNDRLIVDLD